MKISRFVSLSVVGLASTVAFGAPDDKTLGTRKNPVKLSMVPSSDATKILTNMSPVSKCLEKETGLFFEINVPNSYVVVVEALGTKKADVAFLNTFGYLLAHERFGTQAILKASRHGETTYRGQFLVRADSKIQKISDLAGKKVAYVDPASTSGHILPKKLLNDKKVKPAEEVFAGKHDVVVTMVYQGQVDAGATYYNPPSKDGKIRDARERVMTQFPDIQQKVRILETTQEIPNDPIVLRKELPDDMKNKITTAFQKCVVTNTEAFKGINNSDALAAVKDSDYDGVRSMVKELNLDLGKELQKAK